MVGEGRPDRGRDSTFLRARPLVGCLDERLLELVDVLESHKRLTHFHLLGALGNPAVQLSLLFRIFDLSAFRALVCASPFSRHEDGGGLAGPRRPLGGELFSARGKVSLSSRDGLNGVHVQLEVRLCLKEALLSRRLRVRRSCFEARERVALVGREHHARGLRNEFGHEVVCGVSRRRLHEV